MGSDTRSMPKLTDRAVDGISRAMIKVPSIADFLAA
jgi:hypothetical protein